MHTVISTIINLAAIAALIITFRSLRNKNQKIRDLEIDKKALEKDNLIIRERLSQIPKQEIENQK